METIQATQYWLTRFCFQRFLGFIYFIAFLIALHQFKPLAGEHGILPARLFIERVRFWDAPSLFFYNSSDRFVTLIAWIGIFLSAAALTGLSDRFGILISGLVWFLLWMFYLSFVNIGQVFYGFGWETLLLETGFLAIFLGSSDTAPPNVVMWLYRWLIFRVMFGAGMIKIRGDECWRDLTCMAYHYETQPLPNPLSWFLHHLPLLFHKAEVLFTHFVELAVPFGLLVPGPVGYAAALITILFHVILILSGNLSWLNYITILICIPCLNDKFLSKFLFLDVPEMTPDGLVRKGVLILLTVFILLLSVRPAMNLVSSRQLMNASFDSFHFVNTYGAFGSITRVRNEVVIEGTDEAVLTNATHWKEYEFKGKPGDVARAPCIVSPYHWKLDWQMWFAAMSSYQYHPWILSLTAKFLKNDRPVLALIAHNPFPDKPPHFIRARLYEYHFTTPQEKKKTGHWWKRTLVGDYLPSLSLDHPEFRRILELQGWDR